MKDKNDEKNRIFEILNNEIFTTEFISGIAGDRVLDKTQKSLYEKLLRESGGDLYVNLLFYITHQVFENDKAKTLWEEILVHKKHLSRVLKRNVEISVATLDYLTNIKDEMRNPKLIGEAFIGKIAEMASIDGLTKLYNRQYLHVKIDEELRRHDRYGVTFSLLMIDIDDFKKANDTRGHQYGDGVLTRLSGLLDGALRDLDVCSRYGGEEFVIILPHTDGAEAEEIAERIRAAVEEQFKNDMQITVSVGLSNCPNSATTMKGMIKKADDALYESKRRGKNRVTLK
ncbi:MAG: GGDEF domain-containing protein [Spirochaetales bacterium]|nr:GGDEF domain-containing protein [Spirochaetales bacterium]